jgi:WD40 repeat protein
MNKYSPPTPPPSPPPPSPLPSTSESSNTLNIWNVETGAIQSALVGHEGIVDCSCFNRGGTLVLSGSDDSKLRLWSFETGHLLHTADVPMDEHVDHERWPPRSTKQPSFLPSFLHLHLCLSFLLSVRLCVHPSFAFVLLSFRPSVVSSPWSIFPYFLPSPWRLSFLPSPLSFLLSQLSKNTKVADSKLLLLAQWENSPSWLRRLVRADVLCHVAPTPAHVCGAFSRRQ